MYIACNVLESYPSCRCYNNLRPERRLVLDSVSSFVSSVNSSLRAGTVHSYKFCVEFRLNICLVTKELFQKVELVGCTRNVISVLSSSMTTGL